jgi:hypothetical protein
MSDSIDPFEALDVDKLSVVISILKDNEVAYFRCGDVEVGLKPPEPEPAVSGFVPPADRVVNQTQPEDERGYGKAFRGNPPKFKPAPPKD